MPAKQVLQYECDRCPNVWYEPIGKEPLPELAIDISINVPGENPTKMKFTCLCEGCLKTVTNLLVSIGKVTKKVSANRKAKKKDDAETASKDSTPPAAPAETAKPSAAPAAGPALVSPAPKPAVVSVPAAASVVSGKPLQPVVSRPK